MVRQSRTRALRSALSFAVIVTLCVMSEAAQAQSPEGVDTCKSTTVTKPIPAASDDAESERPAVTIPVIECVVETKTRKTTTLQISRMKLNELATSALLNKLLPKAMAAELGADFSIVENQVYRDIVDLNQRYSQPDQELGVTANSLEIGATDASLDYQGFDKNLMAKGAINGGIRNIRYEIAMPTAALAVKDTSGWPEGWNQFYHASDRETSRDRLLLSEALWFRKTQAVRSMRIWRYLRRRDIADYEKNMLEAGEKAREGCYDSAVCFPNLLMDVRRERIDRNRMNNWPKYLSAIQKFTVGEFPKDFLFAFGGLLSGSWEFYLVPRRVHLELEVIENAGTEPIEILQLGLAASIDQNLRKSEDKEAARIVGLAKPNDATWSLAPGARLLIPSRISLEYDPAVKAEFEDIAAATAIYERIRAHPGGTTFEYNVAKRWLDLLWDDPQLKKSQVSFAAPHGPDLQDYVLAQSSPLSYLETFTARVMLNRPEAADGRTNVSFDINFTAHNESGQCPYLLTYDEAAGAYQTYGKVLVSSDWNFEARDQTIELERPTFKFRLEERELEVSFIDQVEMTVKLRGGRQITLKPDIPLLDERDFQPVTLFDGESIDFAFALPTGTSQADIVRSALTIRGHYERYGKILLTRDAKRR